jgi:hypothetical protein
MMEVLIDSILAEDGVTLCRRLGENVKKESAM